MLSKKKHCVQGGNSRYFSRYLETIIFTRIKCIIMLIVFVGGGDKADCLTRDLGL